MDKQRKKEEKDKKMTNIKAFDRTPTLSEIKGIIQRSYWNRRNEIPINILE